MSEKLIKDLVSRHIKLVDTAQDFFKKASLDELKLDTNILYEYKNCVRAQADILGELINSQDMAYIENPVFMENIATANLAAKCIINDCVDILHTACKVTASELNKKYKYPISDFYKDYYSVCEVIKDLDNVVPQTRGEGRRNRIDIYIHEFTAERASIMHKFLSSISEIENQMRFKQGEEEKDKAQEQKKESANWKRVIFQTLVAFVIAFLGWQVGKATTQQQIVILEKNIQK